MSLTPGTRLGSYDISAQIGAGGMGEVYRATDSNLKRAVAIKILPASVAGDADRLARFQREAEVLAALNHPNIAAIYGLEKTADATALVMELIEGEDLSAHIARTDAARRRAVSRAADRRRARSRARTGHRPSRSFEISRRARAESALGPSVCRSVDVERASRFERPWIERARPLLGGKIG